MNSYNLFYPSEPSCIIYHAVAQDIEHVRKMADFIGIDIQDLTIEQERQNVRDQTGRPIKPYFEHAVIH